jgi:hypothetical protein
MLVQIPLLSFLVFGVTYPMFFWLTARDPIKHNFQRFHLACPVIIAGLAIVGLFMLPVDQSLRNCGALWLGAALMMVAAFWNRDSVNIWLVTLLCLWGMAFFAAVYGQLFSGRAIEIVSCLIGGFVVSAIFYAMNLGHFYLNVHGLKIIHLKNAALAFAACLVIRLCWDLMIIASVQTVYAGEAIPVLAFMNSLDGFMLWVALFFGTVFPFFSLYFVFGTLKLKNTQATTGILYVLLSAVLLGDLACKFYLVKFGIPM